MEDKIDRFKKIQELKKQVENQKHLKINADENLVNKLLNSKIDKELVASTEKRLDEKYNFSLTDFDVDDKQATELLKSVNQKYDKEQLNILVSDCKKTILDNIIKPFGIAKYVVAKYDKDGGNVDTIHNVRNKDFDKNNHPNGVYATENEKNKSLDNPKYNSNEYHSHKKYIQKNREGSKQKSNGELKNEYTGETINQNGKSNLDHTISANEIHLDNGRILADLNGPELANSESNLNHTSESINKSRGQITVPEFIEYLGKTKPQRQIRVSNLETRNELTDQERKELGKLKELEKFDKDLALKKDKIAREKYEKKINEYYNSEQFINNTAKTGAIEGTKMGLQQAVGIVLKELTESIFDEISDIYHHGFKGENKLGETFFSVLKERLLNIGNRILLKWKDVVKAFGDGFFSGFLSNFVTVVINMFVTTGKRVVRVIREGFFLLLKALNMLFFPPENMTFREAAHEATKLIVAGLAITGGTLLEQYVDTLLKSIPFADIISTVLVGILTGLATSLLVFLLDKLDLFGVNKEKRHEYVSKELDRMNENSLKNIEEVLQSLEVRVI